MIFLVPPQPGAAVVGTTQLCHAGSYGFGIGVILRRGIRHAPYLQFGIHCSIAVVHYYREEIWVSCTPVFRPCFWRVGPSCNPFLCDDSLQIGFEIGIIFPGNGDLAIRVGSIVPSASVHEVGRLGCVVGNIIVHHCSLRVPPLTGECLPHRKTSPFPSCPILSRPPRP